MSDLSRAPAAGAMPSAAAVLQHPSTFAPATLIFKLEMLQHSGSFKARGAFGNLLTREIPSAGVVAASGGNHGAAVAYAARRLGVRAYAGGSS